MMEYKKRFGEVPFTAEEQRSFTSVVIDEVKEKIKQDRREIADKLKRALKN